MDILKENYFIVDLYGDEKKEYKIICKMGFYDAFVDLRTGRRISILGMHDDIEKPKGLCCKNKVISISYEEVLKIINNLNDCDIEKYNTYLDEIERNYSSINNKKVGKRTRKKVRK